MPAKPKTKGKPKKVAKPKKIKKFPKPKPETVYEEWQELIKKGKGAIAIKALSNKYYCQEWEIQDAIREEQDKKFAKLTSKNDTHLEAMQKEQVKKLTRLKSTDELAAHKAQTQIRVPKDHAFAHTPKQMLEMRRKVFRQFIEHNLGYKKGDIFMLMELFDSWLNEDNIKYYLTRTSREIYIGIINENLDTMANYQQHEITEDLVYHDEHGEAVVITRKKSKTKK